MTPDIIAQGILLALWTLVWRGMLLGFGIFVYYSVRMRRIDLLREQNGYVPLPPAGSWCRLKADCSYWLTGSYPDPQSEQPDDPIEFRRRNG
jgi:hypothetical protein